MQTLPVTLFCFALSLAEIASPFSFRNPRILNGEEAKPGQFPWQVGLLTINPLLNQTKFCGGAIISTEWVLTSAYCIYNSTYSIVYSGTVDLNDPNRALTFAETHIVHENFNPDELRPDRFHYDIGLLKLNTPLVFNDNTKAIALAEEELEAGILVTVSGFGHTTGEYGNDTNSVLNYIVVPTLNNSECGRYLEYADTPGVVCTYFNYGDDVTKNACVGDGGGPVVVDADTDPVHVGLFSFMSSFGCDSRYPSGHTRTAYYRGWIMDQSGV